MTKALKIYLIAVTVALLFLSFILGYASGQIRFLRVGALENALQAARSLYAQLVVYNDPINDGTNWIEINDDRTGVVTFNPDKAWQGLTLYTAGDDTAAKLVDMNGEVVWQWRLPFAEAWPTVEHLSNVAKPEFTKWRKAILYPNGDLLAVYDGAGVTPSGLGLVKVDKDSNLLWKLSESAHHDVQIGDDGNVYTLIYEIQKDQVKLEFEGYDPAAVHNYKLKAPMLIDGIVVMDSDGRELNRINVLDALLDSPWAWILTDAKPSELGDYFHTNSAQPLSEEIAAAFSFAEPGQILISMRELSAIALIDPVTRKAVWAMRGPWIGQHDAEMLANGNILIFDNRGNISGETGITRILEFNPNTYEIKWEYSGTKDAPLSNRIRGAQQRLPNGNTLITSSNQARLVEVTPDKEIVWDYRNPTRAGEDGGMVPVVMWGKRYEAETLEFLD